MLTIHPPHTRSLYDWTGKQVVRTESGSPLPILLDRVSPHLSTFGLCYSVADYFSNQEPFRSPLLPNSLLPFTFSTDSGQFRIVARWARKHSFPSQPESSGFPLAAHVHTFRLAVIATGPGAPQETVPFLNPDNDRILTASPKNDLRFRDLLSRQKGFRRLDPFGGYDLVDDRMAAYSVPGAKGRRSSRVFWPPHPGTGLTTNPNISPVTGAVSGGPDDPTIRMSAQAWAVSTRPIDDPLNRSAGYSPTKARRDAFHTMNYPDPASMVAPALLLIEVHVRRPRISSAHGPKELSPYAYDPSITPMGLHSIPPGSMAFNADNGQSLVFGPLIDALEQHAPHQGRYMPRLYADPLLSLYKLREIFPDAFASISRTLQRLDDARRRPHDPPTPARPSPHTTATILQALKRHGDATLAQDPTAYLPGTVRNPAMPPAQRLKAGPDTGSPTFPVNTSALFADTHAPDQTTSQTTPAHNRDKPDDSPNQDALTYSLNPIYSPVAGASRERQSGLPSHQTDDIVRRIRQQAYDTPIYNERPVALLLLAEQEIQAAKHAQQTQQTQQAE